MSLEFVQEDIFDLGCNVLVCPVNCCGTMGKGLAKRFAARFNGLRKAFRDACQSKQVLPGAVWAWQSEEGPLILCIPTKRYYAELSQIGYVKAGLRALVRFLGQRADAGHSDKVALPALGCGLGGLYWEPVQALIQLFFEDDQTPAQVLALPPQGAIV